MAKRWVYFIDNSYVRPTHGISTAAAVLCLAPRGYLLEITTAKEKYCTKFVKR